jgi:hypothetical protein
MKLFKNEVLAVCAGAALSLAACSSGSGGGDSASASKWPKKCVTAPAETATKKIAWTYEECGPFLDGGVIHFFNDQKGDVEVTTGTTTTITKAAIGIRPINKGHVTFKLTNFDWSDLRLAINNSDPNDCLLAHLQVQSGDYILVGNWHVMAIRGSAAGRVENRLTTQRFDVLGGLTGKPESKEIDMPKYERSKTYRFDITWDTTVPSMYMGQGANIVDGLVSWSIYDATDSAKEILIKTYQTPTLGDYPMLDTFKAGGRISNPQANGVLATTKDFRMTIFAE